MRSAKLSPPFERRAGVLLHPSSLPGPYGAGDIGPSARELLAFCESAGLRIWQVLPLHPTDAGGCPYASPSAFAREPLLLSLDDLEADGWLKHSEKAYLGGDPWRIDHAKLRASRAMPLALAAERIAATVPLEPFRAQHPWVDDWAMFAVLAKQHGADWTRWPAPLRDRLPSALSAAEDQHAHAIASEVALQWAFTQQWTRLRAEAVRRDVQIWGDMPYFVGADSCDVWANKQLFRLDKHGRPSVVTGVPPDAFSPTGQRWGHPHYAEPAHAAQGYAWWQARAKETMALVDVVRIDHFRGLAGVWEIPATAPDARSGKWIRGPGAPLLHALRDALGGLPVVAEDLGVITPDVAALRDDFGLPGMAILQFAFGSGPTNTYLPHNHQQNLAVYTGTHDNDTALGWYRAASGAEQDWCRRYLACPPMDIAGALVRTALRSVANTAIVPMQDLLGIGSEGRMNVPGTDTGNWSWRLGREALNLTLARKVREQVSLSARLAPAPAPTDTELS